MTEAEQSALCMEIKRRDLEDDSFRDSYDWFTVIANDHCLMVFIWESEGIS